MTDAHCHVSGGDPSVRELLIGRDFVGVHPWATLGEARSGRSAHQTLDQSVPIRDNPWLRKIVGDLRERLAANPRLGVGEIGLDRLKEKTISPAMRALFAAQLAVAFEFRRPVVLHGAKCWGEVVKEIIELSNNRIIECGEGKRIIELSNNRIIECGEGKRIIELSNNRIIELSNNRIIESAEAEASGSDDSRRAVENAEGETAVAQAEVKCRSNHNSKIRVFDYSIIFPLLFHGFSRSDGLIPDIVRLNGYVSVGPAVLNDHAVNYRALVKKIPLDRLLVETDRDCAPEDLLNPVTKAPLTVRDVLEKTAELRGLSPAELESLTDANAARFCSFAAPQGRENMV